eukprot:Skav203688  [mRNA]  locus=scaffold259:158032:176789:+ [translate_table: standard]
MDATSCLAAERHCGRSAVMDDLDFTENYCSLLKQGWGQVTRAFGSSLEVVVRISVAEVHSGTLRMVKGAKTAVWLHLRISCAAPETPDADLGVGGLSGQLLGKPRIRTEQLQSAWLKPESVDTEARGHGKTALVTGITGMLGSHVAEALLERGYEVHGVVRPRSNVRNVAAFQSNVKMVTAELTDAWRVLRLVKKLKPDFIFHFAAQAFNSTLHILEAVRELQLSSRLVIAGSSTVYGASTEEWDGPVPEEASMKPVSPYGVSKAATEMSASCPRSCSLFSVDLDVTGSQAVLTETQMPVTSTRVRLTDEQVSMVVRPDLRVWLGIAREPAKMPSRTISRSYDVASVEFRCNSDTTE